MRFRIATYNLLHGLHKLEPPYTLDVERAAAARAVVRSLDADILGLTEACYGAANPFGKRIDYPSFFGYPFGCYARWGRFEWGNCLLSRWPLRWCSMPVTNRTAIRAQVRHPCGDVWVDLVHADPSVGSASHARDFDTMLQDRASPYILLGDLNALSPQDECDFGRLLSGFQGAWGESQGRVTVDRLSRSRLAVEHILTQGLVDAVGQAGNACATVPTAYAAADPAATGVRVDYIFCGAEFRVVSAGAVRSDAADRASDHYPVVAELELSDASSAPARRNRNGRNGVAETAESYARKNAATVPGQRGRRRSASE